MTDPYRPADARPAGTVALTPDQIAAQLNTGTTQQYQTPAQYRPAAPVYAPPAPAQPAPVYAPAPAAVPEPSFAIGTVSTADDLARENAALKKTMARNAVYTAAGGEEQFAAMAAWAKTGRTAAQNETFTAALNNPNVPDSIRAMAVQQVMHEFNTANPTGVQADAFQFMTGDAGVQPGMAHGVTPAVEPISQGEFHARYVHERKQGKTDYDPEMQTLKARRAAGIKARMV